ncbi:NADP-dependent oxidoreductase [Falsigemmobacter faecalis]|uniref:NADP-dependent oxidoreductase n=1 Tax=Falsigemmobacter faecalis TaxID=2488730 RepID=A0A3P3DNB3_9RHOB|nr:NADP-dependent oxidoreductase [Falsigemmobacter faecalis]RRH75166.1 NADP-dependent oxidoreductase [Falsigemmobacter faecalis]
MTRSREIQLAARPTGLPGPETFRLAERELPPPSQGEVLVQIRWLSLDPYMRGRMHEGKSYVEPFRLNEALDGGVIAEVIESADPGFAPGDLALAHGPWGEYAVLKAAGLQKLPRGSRVPPQAFLSVLGMPGMTAWTGLNRIAAAKAGETIVVSSAAGAVGSLAAQLAREKGLRVIGVAGSPEKCAQAVADFGCDACLDHRGKEVKQLSKEIAEAAPHGVDIYFENVGGTTLQAVLPRMNNFGRIALCGAIAWYNDPSAAPPASHVWLPIIQKRLRVEGFIVSDHVAFRGDFLSEVVPLVEAGKILWHETVAEGLDAAPEAFVGLLEGRSRGKQLVRIR